VHSRDSSPALKHGLCSESTTLSYGLFYTTPYYVSGGEEEMSMCLHSCLGVCVFVLFIFWLFSYFMNLFLIKFFLISTFYMYSFSR